MSTARSRARTVHGRTPKTSTQLVDEMSTSKDFQSPDIFALRRRQAQVDAAKRGVSRLRRASVRMSDLPRVSTLEAISGSDDSDSLVYRVTRSNKILLHSLNVTWNRVTV